MLRVARFLHCFLRYPARNVEEREVSLEVGGATVPASVFRPPGGRPAPGWIVLHGMTVPGRAHPGLTRFAHSLAATGAAVLIPEIPAWRELRLDTRAGDETIAAAAAYLREQPDVLPGKLNLVGFSFGATQALMSATRPGVREHVGRVTGFGAYCDLGRALHCMITGEHEWGGKRYTLDPDPYGRWVVAANFLTAAPEHSGLEEVGHAARKLALEAGRSGVFAAEPLFDPLKARLRATLSPAGREVWDLLAPPTGVQPPLEPSRELADALVQGARRQAPDLDPLPRLADLEQQVVLAHGYHDRLIPFTETLRLRSHLPPHIRADASITRLFAHSGGADALPMWNYPAEIGRYLALLHRSLRPR